MTQIKFPDLSMCGHFNYHKHLSLLQGIWALANKVKPFYLQHLYFAIAPYLVYYFTSPSDFHNAPPFSFAPLGQIISDNSLTIT